MDGMSAGVVEGVDTDSGVVVKDVPVGTPQGQDQGGSDKGDQAEGSQDSSDGGSASGQDARQRGKSVYSQMRELRSQLRDQRGYWEGQVGTLKQQLDEIRAQVSQGPQVRKQGKTFWEAPEESIDERLSSHLSEFEKRMASKFEQTQEQREQAAVRSQEVSEAAKFIRTQKGITEDDIQDIRDILKDNPELEGLSPMKQARYALMEWREARGIGDKTAQKNRASSVTGAPAQGSGPKIWTESEINTEMGKFPQNVALWTADDKTRFEKMDAEIRNAYREKRVTK